MIILLIIINIWAQEKTEFICNPPQEIKDRVNEYCNKASQTAVQYKKPVSKKIKNGILLLTSDEDQDGSVVLKMAHQCKGQKVSEWKTFNTFCGYEIVELDRQTPAIKEIRAEIALKNKLNEKQHRDQIDRLVAKQMNAWIADPLKNIFEKDGKVTIKTLQSRLGITCHSPQELTYETNCK
jgi:hypothetical protein